MTAQDRDFNSWEKLTKYNEGRFEPGGTRIRVAVLTRWTLLTVRVWSRPAGALHALDGRVGGWAARLALREWRYGRVRSNAIGDDVPEPVVGDVGDGLRVLVVTVALAVRVLLTEHSNAVFREVVPLAGERRAVGTDHLHGRIDVRAGDANSCSGRLADSVDFRREGREEVHGSAERRGLLSIDRPNADRPFRVDARRRSSPRGALGRVAGVRRVRTPRCPARLRCPPARPAVGCRKSPSRRPAGAPGAGGR